MLRFSNRPEPFLLEIIDDAIRQAIDDLDFEDGEEQRWSYTTEMPRSNRFFTPMEARAQLTALRQASGDTQLYQPSDYYWLLLYETLEKYCDLFNDTPFGLINEKYGIEEIDFDWIIAVFFWDTDFLDDNIGRLSLEQRQALRVSPETFGLSLGMKPHPEELALKIVRDDPSNDDHQETNNSLTGGSKDQRP